MAGESDAVGAGARPTKAFDIRQAERSDVNEIAAAHRDSIQSIGPAYYSDDVVAWWQEAIEGQLYLKAMEGGEVFFIALGDVDGRRAVLGFASDYCIEGRGTGPRSTSVAAQPGRALARRSSRRPKPTRSRPAQEASRSKRRLPVWTSTGRTDSSRCDAGRRA